MGTPTSPVGMSTPYHNLFFYSAPCSPAGETSSESSPFRYQEANSNTDDFEFDSSPSFNLDASDQLIQDSFSLDRSAPRQQGGSPPTMAFADELFRDGKVMPIASPQSPLLKLPPRLAGKEGTVASSPSSKVVGSRKLWNDDFDPFMAALENVMEDKASTDSKTWAQAVPMAKQMKGQIVPKRKLAVPKGFDFAREVRIIQIGQIGKLDKFLKKLSERDQKPESMTKKTPTLLRKPSRGEATLKEEKRVWHPPARSHQLSKMVLMHYNPRGIPCMGYN